MIRFFSRPAVPQPEDLCLVLHAPAAQPQVRPGDQGWWSPRHRLGEVGDPGFFLGDCDGRPVWVLRAPAPDDGSWTPLRRVMAEAPADQAQAAVRAAELAAWRDGHRFCGACGTPTVERVGHTAFDCPACGAEFWPRVTPAVIMLVHRGDEVLLARHARHARPGSPSIHTCLAGFVESGETLEAAVLREVAEEVGVVVGPPTYVASQAWPFPHSLMVGFLAPWVSGEPVPDGDEIVEAAWYRRSSLPEIPPPPTLARGLIRHFFQEML